MGAHALDPLFTPKSIAVVGASDRPESVGARVFENLVKGGYEGELYPVNAKRDTVQDRPAFKSLTAIGKPVDLVMIATPAATVPALIRETGAIGTRAVIVNSAGFGEADGSGRGLQREMLEEARRLRIRILGPNCLGLANPHNRMNATFSQNGAQPGSLALITQSGALATGIMDWAEARGIGFSSLVSLGSAADLDFGELLDYAALDSRTKSILLYIEGIRDARHFVSGLRAAARLKPVIVVKAGRHGAGQKAAASHTASMVGSDAVFDAALRRAGVVRAMTVGQLFAGAQLLATHNRVRGNRLAIVTNAGGPGVLAADRAQDLDVDVVELDPSTMAKLNDALPGAWSHGNPVDVIGDATAERYDAALGAVLEDPKVDGVLTMLTPQAMTEPKAVADVVIKHAKVSRKPVLTCFFGEKHIGPVREHMQEHKVPAFRNPEASVEAFSYLANYRHRQKLLLEVPRPSDTGDQPPDAQGAQLVIDSVLDEGRREMTGIETRALLAAFKIPVVPAVEARTANDALVVAESVGFPVAMKISSPDITHKSDVGGVLLGVASAAEVRHAYNTLIERAKAHRPDAELRGVTVEKMVSRPNGREVIVGVTRDEVFGPVIAFGAGGTAVEVMEDQVVALPPLNDYIARDVIARTRVARVLDAFRDKPAADIDSLVKVLLRISELVCALPGLVELDLNPLIVDENGAIAVDARAVVERPKPTIRRYGHMAIHPYPAELAEQIQLPDGTSLTIRPIRPEDAEAEATFVNSLSDQSKYFRFMRTFAELSPELVVRFTQIDYDREMAFIAVTEDKDQIGVARYVTLPDGETCEFALVVADEWQKKGLGRRLMEPLMAVARDRGLKTMRGDVLSENAPMLRFMKRLGFTERADSEDPGIRVCEYPLR
ncbi:MAG: bifunctional acetate--CoA ligase family protein/GNAT family N-acetyltransferase [Planctomycetota bacterium]|jgi:acetyltransferase